MLGLPSYTKDIWYTMANHQKRTIKGTTLIAITQNSRGKIPHSGCCRKGLEVLKTIFFLIFVRVSKAIFRAQKS